MNGESITANSNAPNGLAPGTQYDPGDYENTAKVVAKGCEPARKFAWTARREQAAYLVAQDRLTNEQIAAEVAITRKQLDVWKTSQVFRDRVQEHINLWRKRIRTRGLAVIENRIQTYERDFQATETILQERGAELPDVAGGKTGYIVRDYKGKDADTPIYSFDAALFRERRAIRQQIAEELGQWSEKTELSGSIETTISIADIIRERRVKRIEAAKLLEAPAEERK